MKARRLVVVVLLAAIAGVLWKGPGVAQMRAPLTEDRGNRGDVLEDLALAEEAWRGHPGDTGATMDYATLLLETGQFERSFEVVDPLLLAEDPPPDAELTAARLCYFMGRYEEAERLFRQVLDRNPSDQRALRGLVFTYYQTNAFHRCAELPREELAGLRLPHLDLMRAFEDDPPYRLAWDGPVRTEVPFVESDPLPVIDVEIDGRKIAAIIDTGADLFILDTDTAESLGVESVATMMAMFAGGKQGEIAFARADSLRLGTATLRSVPISILPTRLLSLGERQIEGIVGTSVLRQFLSTMDYPRGRLVLRERSQAGLSDLERGVAGTVEDEIPFYMQSTHSLLVHGSMNGHGGLLFHVDSGLAGVPAFGAPRETMEYLGIPIPEVAVHEGVIGGGGGGFATGTFPVAELGLGRLVKKDLTGSFGGLPPGSYWHLGFIQDGLVSHNFLREYAWTLDFDGMRMVFSR